MSASGKVELGALWSIVKTLADGKYHSGEDLGVQLGVSRAAVWKYLQRLEGLGIVMSSIKGRGYAIPGGLDLLDQHKIEALLECSIPLTVDVLPIVDSTNSFLMKQEGPSKRACFAEFQTAGRGRRGRNWISPMASNLYCSLGWSFEGGAAAVEGLSLALGVGIIRMLKKRSIFGVELKWPNDVLYQQKKLAGILIEMTGDPAGYCQVIIGVGLNISMHTGQAKNIDQPWVALASIMEEQGVPYISRNEWAAGLLTEMIAILSSYQDSGFAPYQDEWISLAAHRGLNVELLNGQTSIAGVMQGVTETGALQLLTDEGERRFYGGEVSLRGPQ